MNRNFQFLPQGHYLRGRVAIFNFQTFVYSFICIFVYLYIAASANAAGCTPIYGGGPTCTDTTIAIKSQVLNPSTNKFVDNLGSKDAKYEGGDTVTFQISLTNNSTKAVSKTIVKDSFPSVLTFVDGPGKYDKTKNMLTFEVDNLASKHTQLYTVTARVGSQNTFAQDCVINTVSALPSSGTIAQDSSQLCLGKINTTPATGAESLLVLLPTGLLGLLLKRFKIQK